MTENENEKNESEVVSLDTYRADRLIHEKLGEAFSFVPGVDELISDMLEQARTEGGAATEELMDAVRDHVEDELIRLLEEDEGFQSQFIELVLQSANEAGVTIDFDEETAGAPREDRLSAEEEAAVALLQQRLTPEKQELLQRLLETANVSSVDSAFEALDEAELIAPEFFEPPLIRAQRLEQTGNYNEALREVRMAEERCPGSPRVAQCEAIILFESGRKKEAMQRFDEALDQHPWHMGLRRARAFRRQLTDDKEGALLDYERLISAQQFADDYYNRGNVWMGLEDFEAAATDFEKVTELQDWDEQAWTNLGSARARMDDFEGAMDAWAQAIERDPLYPLPYAKRAALWASIEKNYANAMVESLVALVLAPDVWPYERETVVTLELSRAEFEGIEALEEQSDILPWVISNFLDYEAFEAAHAIVEELSNHFEFTSRSLLTAQGILAHQMGEPGRAVETFERALLLEPDDLDTLYYLGMARFAAGHLDAAVTTLEAAANALPEGNVVSLYGWSRDDALLLLARALGAGGNVDEALEILEDLAARSPSADTAFYRGLFLDDAGDIEGSIEAFSEAIAHDPSSAWAWYHRACELALTNDVEGAISDLTRACELEPTCAVAAGDEPYFEALFGDPGYEEIVHFGDSMAELAGEPDPGMRTIFIDDSLIDDDLHELLADFGLVWDAMNHRTPLYHRDVGYLSADRKTELRLLREPTGENRYLLIYGDGADRLANGLLGAHPALESPVQVLSRALDEDADPFDRFVSIRRVASVRTELPEDEVDQALAQLLKSRDSALRWCAVGLGLATDHPGIAERTEELAHNDPDERVRNLAGVRTGTYEAPEIPDVGNEVYLVGDQLQRLERFQFEAWRAGWIPFQETEAEPGSPRCSEWLSPFTDSIISWIDSEMLEMSGVVVVGDPSCLSAIGSPLLSARELLARIAESDDMETAIRRLAFAATGASDSLHETIAEAIPRVDALEPGAQAALVRLVAQHPRPLYRESLRELIEGAAKTRKVAREAAVVYSMVADDEAPEIVNVQMPTTDVVIGDEYLSTEAICEMAARRGWIFVDAENDPETGRAEFIQWRILTGEVQTIAELTFPLFAQAPVLSIYGPGAVDVLKTAKAAGFADLEQLLEESQAADATDRASVFRRLGAFPSPTEEIALAIRRGLTDQSSEVRYSAVAAIGMSNWSEMSADLEEIIDDEDPRVRELAQDLLQAFAGERV